MDEFLSTYVLMIITILFSLKGFNDQLFMEKYLYKPYDVKHHREGYRIFTHILLHADFIHLFFNMFALYGFGRLVEATYRYDYGQPMGTLYFLALYLLGALFATVIPYLRHQDNEWYRSLGASGAVSAVIFAGILMYPKENLLIYGIPIPAYIFGPLYLAFEFWADKRGRTNIAHDAHIGGALFGILFVLITNIDRVKASFYSFF